MSRPRYHLAEEDIPVVHRWVQAKFRDPIWPQPEAARHARDQFPPDPSTAATLQQWCDQYLNVTQWTQLQAVIRAARRDTGQLRTVRLSVQAHARFQNVAEHEELTLSETLERYLPDVTAASTPEATPPTPEKAPAKSNANRTTTPGDGHGPSVPRKQGTAFVTSRKGVCYLTIKIGRHNYSLMRIHHYTIDAQDKRDMRRLHPDIDFDWKKIAYQLAEKREVCRQYRSRRRTVRRPRVPREPFYGVVDPVASTVYVNDPTNIMGMGALLDRMMADERLMGSGQRGRSSL